MDTQMPIEKLSTVTLLSSTTDGSSPMRSTDNAKFYFTTGVTTQSDTTALVTKVASDSDKTSLSVIGF
jgi:hypothetical protein